MNNSYKLAACYLVVFIVAVIAMPASKFSIMYLILIAIAFLIHRHLILNRKSQIDWASVDRPVAIVDWGEAGRYFEVPKYHVGYVVTCSAAEVESKYLDTIAELKAAGNKIYLQGNLPVLKIYFRDGENVLHSQEDHEAHVKTVLDAALLAFEIQLKKDADEADRIRVRFSQNQNGSLPR